MKLGDKIYTCRKKAGWSQEELGERLGVSRQAISKWEVGTAAPDLDNLAALAKLFGVTTDWLLNMEEDAEEPSDAAEPSADTGEPSVDTAEPPSSLHQHLHGLKGLIARYGWLAGIYVALSGAGIALVGGIARYAANRMMRGFDAAWGMPGMGIQIEGGENLPPEVLAEIAGEFGGMTGDPFASMAANNPVSIVGGIILVLGLIVCVAGLVLAWILKKKGDSWNASQK